MNELVVQGEVGERILTLRGKEVMLDRDLAELYGVETKRINEAVRNNKDKFLEDFYFELIRAFISSLLSLFNLSDFTVSFSIFSKALSISFSITHPKPLLLRLFNNCFVCCLFIINLIC